MTRVLRAGDAVVVPLEVMDAREQASRIVEEARAFAASEREALVRGLRDEALAEARAELAARLFAVERERGEALDELERSVVAIALTATRRLVGEELDAKPERVREVAREALAKVHRATRLRLRVNPDDARAVAGLRAEVVEDASIARGGCVVESELGDVDARLEVRLEALARVLEGAR
jgi:flagellar biosynthesis/type III secretory pathway protein FliH